MFINLLHLQRLVNTVGFNSENNYNIINVNGRLIKLFDWKWISYVLHKKKEYNNLQNEKWKLYKKKRNKIFYSIALWSSSQSLTLRCDQPLFRQRYTYNSYDSFFIRLNLKFFFFLLKSIEFFPHKHLGTNFYTQHFGCNGCYAVFLMADGHGWFWIP